MKFTLEWQNFEREVKQPDEKINLAKAALFFAQTEYPTIEPNEYLNTLDTMAEELRERLPETLYPLKIIKTINQYLFDDLGFCGNSNDYYDPRNSFLNEVIDRRQGIPITLSVIYLEIARRIDFPMRGIGMPGHFLIRPEFENVGIFVDAFNRGEVLFEQDCEQRLQQIYQQPVMLEPHFLNLVSKRQILSRILTNLKLIYLNRHELFKALTTVEGILRLFPHHPLEIRDRGLIYYQLNEWQEATKDLELYLRLLPNAEDADRIIQLLEIIR